MLWLPKRTQLWACFNTEPNRLYRRLRLFPSKLQEYTPPPFSRLSTQYHIDPLLTCLLSHDTSRTSLRLQRSTKFSNRQILRMGDMNIHITWLTHVRTGPQKKNRSRTGSYAYAIFLFHSVSLSSPQFLSGNGSLTVHCAWSEFIIFHAGKSMIQMHSSNYRAYS